MCRGASLRVVFRFVLFKANDAESPADELPEVRLRLRHNEAQVPRIGNQQLGRGRGFASLEWSQQVSCFAMSLLQVFFVFFAPA